MKHKKLLVIPIACIAIVLIIILALHQQQLAKLKAVDNMPGSVVGENPDYIPESKLPVCNFTSSNFVKQPCYSPPGVFYL